MSCALHLLALAGFSWWASRPASVQWIDLRLSLPAAPIPDKAREAPPKPLSIPTAPAPATKVSRPTASTQPRPQPNTHPQASPAKIQTPAPAAEPVSILPLSQGEQPPESVTPTAEPAPVPLAPGKSLTAESAAPAANAIAPDQVPAGSFESGERDRYLAQLREKIEQALEYPATARRMRWTGTVQVSFLITAAGAVQNLRIQTSCGYPLLDREALQAVRRAAPFAAPPQATAVVLPIVFELR